MTNRYVGIKKQAGDYDSETWTDQTSSNAHFLDAVSEDIGQDRGLIFPETSAQRVMRNRLPGPISISGDVQVPVYTIGTPTLFYYALGAATTETIASPNGHFMHTIKAANVPPTFQMEIGKDRKAHRYVGCVVKGMTIDYDPAESVLATFEVMPRKEIAAADLASVTFPDYNILERASSGTEIATEINDAVADFMESVSIEMDNGFVDDNHVLGNRYIPEKYVQTLDLSGSMEIGYDSYDRYESVVDEEQWKVELSQTHGTADTTRSFKVELPQIALMTANLPTEGSDRFILSVDFKGERQASSDDLIVITVQNKEAATAIVA